MRLGRSSNHICLLGIFFSVKIIQALPQLDAPDLDPVLIADIASVENPDDCESNNIQSLLPGSEQLSLQNDPSDLEFPDVPDLTKRLISNEDSEYLSQKSCPAPNQKIQPANSPSASPAGVKPDECQIDSKTQRCEVARPMLVYSRTCEAATDNDQVTLELIKMVGSAAGVHASKIKGCGIYFWFVKLKRSQVSRLSKFKAVRGIAPDAKIEHYGITGKQASPKEPAIRKSGNRLRKRDRISTRLNQGGDLAHISTAPGRYSGHNVYTFFRSAGMTAGGRRTIAYVLGDGVNEENFEMQRLPTSLNPRTSVISRWAYGLGVDRRRTIEAQDRHITSCLISKIAGARNGVASEADVVMVKVLHECSSFMDGLIEVINDIKNQNRDVAGFTVVSISHGWRAERISSLNIEGMKKLLQTLESLGVVIVCAAGKNEQVSDPVNTYPALWSRETDMSIITVGSIQQLGERTPYWSPTGDAVTVSAPGFCDCATSLPGRSMIKGMGTSISSSLVTGLVLAFAALEDVRPKLRAYPNVPRAFKAYLVRKAYVRRGGSALAVWNGLSGEITDQWIPDTDDLY